MEKKEKKEKKRRARSIWVPLTTTLLASTTIVSTGLAIYFALRRSVAKTYTITIDADGGIIYGGETQKILDGSLVGQIPTPFRDDKVFDYWEETTTNTQLNPQDPITHNMSIKAHWKDAVNAHTVTLNLDGGSISGTTGETVTIKVLDKTLVGTLPTPSKDYSYFDHWEKDGTKVEPTVEITGDITLKAVYQPITAYYLSDGSRVLHVMKDAGGSTATPWKFMKLTSEGTTEITDAEWSAQKPQTGFPGDVSASNGYITVSNLTDTGSYTVSITAKKDGHNVSTDIGIVITDPVYRLSGSNNVSVTPYETVTSTWTCTREGTSYTPTWALSGQPTGVTINSSTGVITYANVAKQANPYTFKVQAKKDDTVLAEQTITLTSSDVAYKISGGSSYKAIKSNETVSDTAWNLYKGNDKVESGVTWSLTTNPDPTSGTIAIDSTSGVVTYTNVAKNTYTLTITASIGGTAVTSITSTVVSSDVIYEVVYSGTSQVFKCNDKETTTDTNTFSLTKDGTTVSSGIQWNVTDESGTAITGLSINNENKLVGASVAGGTYGIKVSATDTGGTVTYATYKMTVVSESTHIVALQIDGDSTIYMNTGYSTGYEYEAKPIGGPTSPTVSYSWSITGWTGTGGTTGTTVPTLSTTTGSKITVKPKNIVDCQGTLTLTLKDTVSGETSTKAIEIKNPTVNSSDIWFYSTEKSSWCKFADNTEFSSDAISYYDLGGTKYASSITRASFNYDVYLGDKVSAIADDFLNDCTIFNSTINFPTDGVCSLVGNGFLSGCKAFNKQLTLPDTVQILGDDFLSGCEAWNNGATVFTFPTALTTIGEYFMSGCKAFNQDLTIPATIGKIGIDFMYNCEAMTSTLYINTDADNFDEKTGASYSNTLATTNADAACYTTGIKIAGTYASDFMDKFPNRTDESPYRNLVADFTTCSWSEISTWATKFEAGTVTEAQFAKHFNKTQLSDFLGLTKTITMNGIEHKVKVVGTNHDELTDGSGTAALTFQLDGYLKNSEGKRINSQWSPSGGNSKDYLSSTLRTNIDALESSTLPSDLSAVIKSVKKTVCIYDDTETKWNAEQYDTKLFGFTATELGATTTIPEGTAYTNPTIVFESWNAIWTVSPNTDNTAFDSGWYVFNGEIDGDQDITGEQGICFGFCI